MKFSFACSCGDTTTVSSTSREEAVQQIKALMGIDAIRSHMAERHPGQPLPTSEQMSMQIEAGVVQSPDEPVIVA